MRRLEEGRMEELERMKRSSEERMKGMEELKSLGSENSLGRAGKIRRWGNDFDDIS